MNRREILEIASETGIQAPRQYHIIDFAKRVAQLEREACAKIAEIAEPYTCADLIRARGQE